MNIGGSILWKTATIILLGLAAGVLIYLSIQKFSDQILAPLNELSGPLEKLKAVNQLSSDINSSSFLYTQLNQSGSARDLGRFEQQNKKLLLIIDSLRLLTADNPQQQLLIDSISNLLSERKKRLINFYNERKKLEQGSFKNEDITRISDILSEDKSISETIIVQERETITTTRLDTLESEKKKGNLISRIFSKKKAPEIQAIEEQESRASSDTTIFEQTNNNAADKAKDYLKDVNTAKQKKLIAIQRKERELQAFENDFNKKIYHLILTIENDLNVQADLAKEAADSSLQKNIKFTSIIFGLLLFSSLVMLYQIFRDVKRNQKNKLLLEAAKEEAEQQTRYKQVFLSNMSHEIRTPLQSIVGYTEQLKQQPENEGYLNAVQQASEHLLKVVNEVLEHSSIQSGKFSFEKIDFDLGVLLQEVENIMRPQAVQKGLELQVLNAPPLETWLMGDPYRLKQMLLNLLGNAIKFTERGSVTLELHERDESLNNWFIFKIKDTGIGIPVELQSKIFDQFEQVAPDMGMRRSGTGLGLAITRALIEGQNGEISFKSIPAKGTEFMFKLPFEKGKPAPRHPVSSLKHVNLNGMVWLVDDDKLIMQLCSLVLQKYHIAHICFDTAEDVLHQTTEEAPEIIIMDIRMPKISGIELCKAVREKYGEKIKIVALTAHVLPEEKKEILESGFDHVLTKPFREIEMITLLTKYLHDEGQNQVAETENKNSNDTFDAFLHSLTEEEKMLIIPQFINESNDDLRQLENGIADADPTKIFETLHRLAGRLLQVGATTYGSKARKLESYMRSHENEMPIEKILTLKKHIAAMIEALEVPTV